MQKKHLSNGMFFLFRIGLGYCLHWVCFNSPLGYYQFSTKSPLGFFVFLYVELFIFLYRENCITRKSIFYSYM